MSQGSLSLAGALGVSLLSMFIVFVGLILLYFLLKLFPLFFRAAAPAAVSAAVPAEDSRDSSELIAVLTAAVGSYERQKGGNPLVRSTGEFYPATATDIVAKDPTARSCVHMKEDKSEE